MHLLSLLERARQYPLFTVADCQKWFPRDQRGVLLLQLNHYVRQARFRRLRRGLYLLPEALPTHPFAIASRLRPEAVISLESVLSESGLIPETVFAVTAVTSGRNARFNFPEIGSFIFRHLEPVHIFGWRPQQFPPYAARVASPEKALLDLLWFHIREADKINYLKELRLHFMADFSWRNFRALARQFNSQRLMEFARLTERAHD